MCEKYWLYSTPLISTLKSEKGVVNEEVSTMAFNKSDVANMDVVIIKCWIAFKLFFFTIIVCMFVLPNKENESDNWVFKKVVSYTTLSARWLVVW